MKPSNWNWGILVSVISLLSPMVKAADITGAWKVSGSVFFNSVDTTCHFKKDGNAILATCENDSGPGTYTPATVDGAKIVWSWDAGPAVLTFQATLTSDSSMKGTIEVRGFTGTFEAVRRP